MVWHRLKGNRLGVKFRRQHVINRFIVDFYCPKLGLVIEIDGKIHDIQFGRYRERDSILTGLGCQIVRFSNEEVLHSPKAVVQKIRNKITEISGQPAP